METARRGQADVSVAGALPRGSTEREVHGSGAFAALSVPHYPKLWAIGLLLNLARWGTLFLCSYLVNQLTDSTLLVQLVGASIFAPMFFGGAVAGVISDRLDRRLTLLLLAALLIPIALLMAVVNLAGWVEVWMVYPFALAVGTGLLGDMTARRALVYDLVGPRMLTNALALEALGMTTGAMLGSFGAGTVISALGVGATFLLIAAAFILIFGLLLFVPKGARQRSQSIRPSLRSELTAGLRYVRSQKTLISILGFTVIMNTFYFTFIPMVPVFGDRLGVSAFWSGLLLTANSLGSITGATLIARGLPLGRGLIYVGGSTIALSFLLVFAAVDVYPVALLAMAIAGLGLSGFATMQSALVMTSSDDEMRGRAMGVLSMGIGALPFAMLLLGGVAQVVGPAAGVVLSVGCGLTAIALWSLNRPETLRIR